MSQQPVTTVGRVHALRLGQTRPEALLWQQLRAGRLDGLKFRRLVVVAPYIADFLCHEAKLIVEVDDSSHADRADYDEARTRTLEARGFRVHRVWNNDVTQRMAQVLEAILAVARAPLPGASRLSLSASQRGWEE